MSNFTNLQNKSDSKRKGTINLTYLTLIQNQNLNFAWKIFTRTIVTCMYNQKDQSDNSWNVPPDIWYVSDSLSLVSRALNRSQMTATAKYGHGSPVTKVHIFTQTGVECTPLPVKASAFRRKSITWKNCYSPECPTARGATPATWQLFTRLPNNLRA